MTDNVKPLLPTFHAEGIDLNFINLRASISFRAVSCVITPCQLGIGVPFSYSKSGATCLRRVSAPTTRNHHGDLHSIYTSVSGLVHTMKLALVGFIFMGRLLPCPTSTISTRKYSCPHLGTPRGICPASTQYVVPTHPQLVYWCTAYHKLGMAVCCGPDLDDDLDQSRESFINDNRWCSSLPDVRNMITAILADIQTSKRYLAYEMLILTYGPTHRRAVFHLNMFATVLYTIVRQRNAKVYCHIPAALLSIIRIVLS